MQHALVGHLFRLGRLRRGFSEFLILTVVIAGLLCVAAALLAFWDNQGSAPGLRRVAGAIIPPNGAVAFVGVVAASLMTLTSITFTMLLIAVQQTSSTLGAVVFDQYLRRRANQVYVGCFVGATAFSFIVLACAGSGDTPVTGALVCLVLTVGTLAALPLLIHSTVDQMRPESVANSIRQLALRAHDHELLLLTGTRRRRRSPVAAPTQTVVAEDGGYVVGIDPRALADTAREVGEDAEVILPVLLGSYVASGEPLAALAGVAVDDDRFDAAVRSAFMVDDARQVESDSGYSVDQLLNIAWADLSTQSPLITTAAVEQLRDLAGRWAAGEERTLDATTEPGSPLPVVYTDGTVVRVIEGLGALLTAAARSGQTTTVVHVVVAHTHALPRLRSDQHRTALTRSLDAALLAVPDQSPTRSLLDALVGLVDALGTAGLDGERAQRALDAVRAADRPRRSH